MTSDLLEGGWRLHGVPKTSSRPGAPVISVITVVFNDFAHVERTILSVLDQTYSNIEYIVVDGGSNDGTVDVLKKYDSSIAYWVSCPDKGIYDAMNKGIAAATGDVIGFLNSRDTYRPNGLEIVARYISKHVKADYFFGSVMKGTLRSGIKPYKIYWNFNFHTCHSVGFFIRRSAQDRVGPYSLKYKCSADYDLFFRMLVKHKLSGVASKPDELVGDFDQHGYSSQLNYIEHLFEETRIRLDNGQSRWVVLFIFVARYLLNRRRLS
jgi:glycosyltransferase involved in cell wall biosynthesis